MSKAFICSQVGHSKLLDYKLNILNIFLTVTMTQGNRYVFLIILMVNQLTQPTNGYTLNACYIKSSDSNSVLCQRTPFSSIPCDGRDISVTAMTMYVVRRCNSILQCGSAVDCCSIYTNETTPVPNSIKHLYSCTTEQCLKISLQELPSTDKYYQVLKAIYICDSKTIPYSTPSTKTPLSIQTTTVNQLSQPTSGYTLNACYIKSSDSNSVLCQRTPFSSLPCDGRDISVTAMTMYVVRRCNSILQCGSAVDCCLIYTNETTPVPNSIKHLYLCTTEQCLKISLQELPSTGEYYHVLRTTYSCNSKTAQYSTSLTRTTRQPTAEEQYNGSKKGSSTTSSETNSITVPTNSSENFSEKVAEIKDWKILIYVSIPVVVVLVAVVFGFVLRRRAKISNSSNGQSLPGSEYYNIRFHGHAPDQQTSDQSSSNQVNDADMTAIKARNQADETRSYHMDHRANVATQPSASLPSSGVDSPDSVNLYSDLAPTTDDTPYASLHVTPTSTSIDNS